MCKSKECPCGDSCIAKCPTEDLKLEHAPISEPVEAISATELLDFLDGRALTPEARKVLAHRGLIEIQKQVHANAKDKGWWDLSDAQEEQYNILLGQAEAMDAVDATDVGDAFRAHAKRIKDAPRRNFGEAIALIQSECSEALEADRQGDPADDKVPEFSGREAELADVVIRVFDLAEGLGLRVPEAIMAKHEYNKTRKRRHGKKY